MPRQGRKKSSPTRTAREELDADYVDESHMEAYARALATDDWNDTDVDVPLSSPNLSAQSTHRRVRKVSALSDFAPINERVTRRRKRGKSHDRRTEWTYILVRWPLLFLIFAFIGLEFSLYLLIRQIVNTKEWLLAWRGQKGKLRARMRAAKTYQQWKDTASELDSYLQFDEWKAIDEDAFYDWRLVRKVRKSLKTLRENNDVRGVLGVLETCLRTNFAGIESARLYSETFYGTKNLIEAYLNEIERSMTFVRESNELSTDEKRRFFKSANTNFGTSALCLSGGAAFGYYHFGVAKALLDADLLPRVVTGTSAGAAVAALICTHTDEELRQLITPALSRRISIFEEPASVWVPRFLKTGARFDAVHWARASSWWTRGSMTFKEAYERTGRILNISVIPADRHSPTKLLNYLTTPDTVIWSAILASAAVPSILNPVVLMQKLKNGTIVPWNWGSKFKDGSLRVDIPIQALNLYFNVTHPIVSQVNPHVHLFFFAPRGSAGRPVAHRKGKGWRGNFLLSAAEQWLKHELTKNFKVIRDLELLPQLLGQDWSSVWLQRFDGAVTIWPRTRLLDWPQILTDPDETQLARQINVGQSVTWPKLHMIENRMRLERQIMLGRQAVRKLMRSSRSQANSSLDPVSPERPLENIGGYEPMMPADTDAEAAFARGAEHFFKRARTGGSPQPDWPELLSQELSRRDVRRRKAVTNLFENRPQSERSRAPTPDPVPDDEIDENPFLSNAGLRSPPTFFNAPSSPTTFFNRLRSPSFPGFPSPFASMRRRGPSASAVTRSTTIRESSESSWDSNSSESDSVLASLPITSFGRHAPQAPVTASLDSEGGEEPDVDV